MREHLEDIAANRVEAIARDMGLRTEEVSRMIKVIKGLDPRPGANYTGSATGYVVPDVEVEGDPGGPGVTQGQRAPKLMVSGYALGVLRQAKHDSDQEVVSYSATESIRRCC